MRRRSLALAAILLGGGAALAQVPRMKAIVFHDYGSPAVLRLEEVDLPPVGDNAVLVRVRAASVNPLDWHVMEGTPYVARLLAFGLFGPKVRRLGVDFAGTVAAVGANVTDLKPGDEVFGGRTGAFAEYVSVSAESAVVRKPPGVTFEQAASIPIAAITALQALRDDGKLQAGQKVLINGASGGVGTFAVQIARTLGAHVTGVCSTRNVELVRSLGAEQVIDYTRADYTEGDERYDLIVDNVGNRPLLANRRVLGPHGRYVLVGGGGLGDNRWIGPLARPLRALVLSRLVSQDLGVMLAQLTKKDLTFLGDLVQSGKLNPVIDRRYRLDEVPEALRYLETSRARGKVVITLEPGAAPAAAAPPAGADERSGTALIAAALIGILAGVSIVPIVAALALDRRFRRRHPGMRPFRWGYYFSIMSFVGGLLLGVILEAGAIGLLACGAVYAALAWCFARRQRWAWLALTLVSFNPVAWVINAVYLSRRWAEGRA